MAMHSEVSESTPQYREAHGIERVPARVTSNTFLVLGGASILASAALKFTHRDDLSLFVGQWAPTFFILGTLSKLMDRTRFGATPAYAH